MDIALLGFGDKDVDTVLAWIMFAFVAVCASIVIFLLSRHAHQKRKARKHAKKHNGNHHAKPRHHAKS